MRRIMRFLGKALHRIIVAAGALAIGGAILAMANYAATQGSGTTFGSVVVSTVHYAQQMLCDLTTPSQCAAVSAAGAVKVDGSAVTQPISAASLPALPANQSVNVNQQAGTTLGTPVAYGSTPTGNAASVNAFVTNANTNGPASAANSSPVVLAISGNSASAATGVTCGSAVSSCVLKASAGNFYGVYAECTSACWLMVFNSTSAPANGATTAGTASGNMVECVDIAANSARSISYPVFPTNYSVGVTAVISSTACATLTLSTVGFIRGTVL